MNHDIRTNVNALREILKSSGRKLASEVSSRISKGQEEGLKGLKGLIYTVGSLGRSKGRGAEVDEDNDDDTKVTAEKPITDKMMNGRDHRDWADIHPYLETSMLASFYPPVMYNGTPPYPSFYRGM